MHVIIFEDAMSQQLFPATIVRPAFAINIGTYRLIDLVRRFSDQIEVLVRPHLKKIVMQDCPDIWTAEGSEHGVNTFFPAAGSLVDVGIAHG